MVRMGFAVLVTWAMVAPAAADYVTGVRHWGRGDFDSAAIEFLPAAEAGEAEAQFMVGRLYALGDGVPQDFVQAWVWHDRAARQGHAMAAQARDSLEQILTPAQLAAARGANAPALAQAPAATPVRPQLPVEGRTVVLVPRQGVVAAPPSRPRAPARLVAPGATEEGSLLASGDLSLRVKEVQRLLLRAGYYDGPADGALTTATRQAIRDYQRDTGLPQTGLFSARMVEQLAQSDQQQAAR